MAVVARVESCGSLSAHGSDVSRVVQIAGESPAALATLLVALLLVALLCFSTKTHLFELDEEIRISRSPESVKVVPTYLVGVTVHLDNPVTRVSALSFHRGGVCCLTHK